MSVLHKNGIPTALITGGFKFQADIAVNALKMTHAFAACDYYWDSSGYLSHWNILPGDFRGKIHFMKMLAYEYQILIQECLFVGDGDNDVHLTHAVGLSIGFNGPAELSNVTTHSIVQNDGCESLSPILSIIRIAK